MIKIFKNHETKRNNKKNPKDDVDDALMAPIAIGSFLTVLILGLFLIFGIYFLASVMAGVKIGDTTSTFQASQILLWFTLLGLIIFVLLIKLLSLKHNFFLYCCKWLVYIFAPLILIGTSISFVVQSVQAGKEREASINSGCDMSTQLSKARNSTYFIGTDTGSGSAFAIDPDGDLVTANHVVEGMKNLFTYITGPDGKPVKIPVTIVRTAPAYDLALLNINNPTTTYLPLGNISDGLIGTDVYGVGFPGNNFEAGYASVTKGIVSRFVQTSDIPNAPADLSYVQTDAALNHGNSGGPLISSCGVIGVVDQASDTQGLEEYGIASEQNISYATSSDTVKKVLGLK